MSGDYDGELHEPSARGENSYRACSVSRNFVNLVCPSCAANSIDLPKWNWVIKRTFQKFARRVASFDWRILATPARDAKLGV